MRFDLPFRTRSLKAKLIFSYLLILAAGGLATSIVGSWIVSTTIMRQAQRAAEHDLAAARTLYEQQLEAVRRTVQLVAGDSAVTHCLVAVLACQELRERLDRVSSEAGLDFLTLADRQGRVVVRARQPSRVGDDASTIGVVRAALAGRVAAATDIMTPAQLALESPELPDRAAVRILPTPRATPLSRAEERSGMVVIAAAPVGSGTDGAQGALYAGTLLNRRFELVDRVWHLLYQGELHRGRAVGTVTIFQGDLRIATTVRSERGQRAVGTRVSDEVRQAVLDHGETWSDRAFVVNDWYISAYEPIRDLEGDVIGILYVGLLEHVYTAIRDRVIISFFAIATLGFALIIGVTYVMIENMTRPIGEMVAATQNITAGRLDQEIQSAADGEIAELAESFNTMLGSLRHMKSDLERWGRTLEEKVQERTDELLAMQLRMAQSERLASLGMLAAGVAHEINNPLGGILALTSLTLEDVAADDPCRGNLAEVVRQTERCRDIVRGLLDFSRQSDVSMETVDINRTLRNTLALVTQQATFFNVTVIERLDPDLPLVTADRSQLQQVFLNLLLNAAQAMEERGTITITSRYSQGDESAEVLLADTGRGIPAEDISRVFDPFFTTKANGQGTGLGLAIAYGIITRHGGTISVRSELGVGTTFVIRLPTAAAAPS